MSCEGYLTAIGKPKNKIDCIAWLLLNVFGCKFCETCRDMSCNIKDGELCTDNIANYIREAVEEENKITADVVEVRHGVWVKKDLNNPLYESKQAPHCSICGEMSFIRYKYCPDCGAKMDGERREE